MTTFTVDVSFSTHDALQRGVVITGVSRVFVLANDGDDAQLVAAQITACRGVMPTATTVCI